MSSTSHRSGIGKLRSVAPEGADRGMMPALRRAVRREGAAWSSIFRFMFRRPRVPAGTLGFGYDKPIRGILVTFVVLCVIEVPIIDLLVHPWPWVRIPLLVVGIWGALFMVGLLCGYLTRLHSVGPEGIRVRSGGEVDLDLPWDVVASVSRRRRSVASQKAFTLIGEGDEQILNCLMQDQTQIGIELEGPTRLMLPTGGVTVRKMRISVDDPPAFLDAVSRFMP